MASRGPHRGNLAVARFGEGKRAPTRPSKRRGLTADHRELADIRMDCAGEVAATVASSECSTPGVAAKRGVALARARLRGSREA